MRVAECIHTPRLVIRCWRPEDAAALLEALESSLDHLRPWLEWAHREPQPLLDKAAKLSQWQKLFQQGQDFFYGIFSPDETKVLGGIGSHRQIGTGAAELGYWIRASHCGQGLITEAAGALTRVGMEADQLSRLEIHCDPKNVASARIPQKLGYRRFAQVRNCVSVPQLPQRDSDLWEMTRPMYAESCAAQARVKVYDADGARLM